MTHIGCGFALGVATAFIVLPVFRSTRVGILLAVAIATGALFAYLSNRYGDRFWMSLRSWWWP